jgi:hypothetical protein
VLKGCTKTTFDPLRAASHLAAKASCARESLPQLIFVALHAANLSQLLKDVPFFFVRKTLLERQQFPETRKSKYSSGLLPCLFVNRHAKMWLS